MARQKDEETLQIHVADNTKVINELSKTVEDLNGALAKETHFHAAAKEEAEEFKAKADKVLSDVKKLRNKRF